jgi:hypothetical protein
MTALLVMTGLGLFSLITAEIASLLVEASRPETHEE